MTSASTTTDCNCGRHYGRCLIRAFLAGMAISIGGCVYMACDVKWVGAILFSVGLMTVVAFGFDLYTGKIGYAVEKPLSYMKDIVVIIIGNFIGCMLVGLMMPYDAAGPAVDAKLALDWYQVVFKGVMCGILMFIAVDFYKQRKSFLAIFFCVPVFILAGFEHSIADMFYFWSARVMTPEALVFIGLVIIGNGIGGMLIPFCRKYMNEPEGS